MPYIIALLGLLAGAHFWMTQTRAAADAARDSAVSTRQREALEEIARLYRSARSQALQ